MNRTIELKNIIKENTFELNIVFKNPTGEVKIYEEPSIRSDVIMTFLADPKSYNGFKKVVLI
ncbi:hypothetical protein CQA49_07970 [Helicobacter sp. MIT 00-7814]|nr:hypothetical protein CQA49_07970 [Helicobacter sp. MIT 00-7814]RDU55918.1 hypothetical protein CQA37_03220 [Helicobacter sp. MIT 99-10781]